MSERLRESLSAVMDGEANQFEVRRVLDELRRDAPLRGDWLRFSQVSAALQGAPANARRGLADQVWKRLQDDSSNVPEASAEGRRRPNHSPAWGHLTAVAALAAVGISFGVLFTDVREGEQAVPDKAADSQVENPQPATAGAPSHQELAEIEAYIVQHMQHKAANHPDVAAMTKLAVSEVGASGP